MAKTKPKTADAYIASSPWAEELAKLRNPLLAAGLDESIKWGVPCYSHKGKNLVSIVGFKAHFAMMFFQGALLSDPDNVLINAGEGKTKALRQWRFTSGSQIRVTKIKAYAKEAVSLVDQGKEIKPERNKPVELPDELEQAFRKDKKARAAYDALTPGRQREYALHVSEAKREATRLSRTEKVLPMILEGKGLHDKYRNC